MTDDNSSQTQEDRRVAALGRYRVMNTAREGAFDDLAALAAEICGTPIAVVNLIASDRQWFKAEVGLGVDSTPLKTSFCVTAILEEDFLLVPDATQDDRFACNPLVTGEPGLRFYAGAVLNSSDGFAIGTLCVLDYEPRSLTEQQQRALRRLAGQAMAQLELRLALIEREETNAELRTSDARFRAAVNAVGGVLWTNNRLGQMTGEQPAWAALTGQTIEEYEGYGWSKAVHPDDTQPTINAWEAAVAEKRAFIFEHRVRRHDGAWRHFSIRAIPTFDADGEIDEWVGVHTDITEQRAAGEAWRALNADLERQVVERTRERGLIWQLSLDLLSVIDMETGRFDAVNPAWSKALGWATDEFVGHSYEDFVNPEDVGASVEAFERVQRGEPVLQFENRYRTRTGDWRWLSWVAVPEDGKLYSVTRDVTAERERRAELEAAQDALRQSQKLEAIGQLTGGVAHDFNNLLTVIRGSVDLLRRGELTEEKRGRYIDAIGDTADRAAKLTGQLLSFARRQALSADLFDVGASLREVATMLQTMTGSRITLDLQVPEEPYFIIADRSQFDTAIVNMGINARDAMAGEGNLTISTGPVSGIPTIRGHAAVAGDFVAVTVADTGAGIARDQLDRIFEPFFTTKGVGQGTGLGLSQVIGFAKQSGGDIRVDSTPGEGTTFTLYLPLASPDETIGSTEKEEQSRVDGDGACVLVVEDNQDVGDFVTAALGELGYESVLATDALAALAVLDANVNRFHVVFSDVVMPGISGLELGQEVRRRYPDIPVILTSGYSHVLAQNGRHGFELLHKPYSIEQLSRVLRKVLTWRSAQADEDRPAILRRCRTGSLAERDFNTPHGVTTVSFGCKNVNRVPSGEFHRHGHHNPPDI